MVKLLLRVRKVSSGEFSHLNVMVVTITRDTVLQDVEVVLPLLSLRLGVAGPPARKVGEISVTLQGPPRLFARALLSFPFPHCSQ